jgi:hypothetical protein
MRSGEGAALTKGNQQLLNEPIEPRCSRRAIDKGRD